MGYSPAVSESVLEAVGIHDHDYFDYDAGHFSEGQTRRLSMARLIVAERPVWLLDEPTASLDIGGEAIVSDLVRKHRAKGGVAVIATHHDLDVGPVETLTLGKR
jgi:heme exporter protein A